MMKIILQGFTQYELNDKNNTAMVHHSECFCIIQRSIHFNSKEYLVTGIKEGCLHNDIPYNDHYVCFDDDVQISSIEKNTFINSPKIKILEIPASLEEFKDGWCNSVEILDQLKISPKNKNFQIINKKMLIGKSNPKKDAFDVLIFACRDITQAKIPSYIKRISPFCLSNCSNLTQFELSENSELHTICNDAFSGSPINRLFIPSQLTELKDGWCANTPNLNLITISPKNKNFKIIDKKMIIGKSNLNEDIFDVLVFACRDIEEAIIPSYIKCISPYCFEKCKRLETIKFEDESQLVAIGNNAFSKSSICNLFIPLQITDLKNGWCEKTSKLNRISISPNNRNYKIIDKKMIVGKSNSNEDIFDVLVFACRDIEEAIIPSYIKCISPYCFEECRLLKKVEFCSDSQLNTIGKFSFSKSSIESIMIPQNCEQIKEGAFYKCKFLNTVQFEENSKLDTIDEKSFSKTSIKTINIPKHTKKIEKDAFNGCNLLTTINFHNNSKLDSIGEQAFMNTSLIRIKIPPHVKLIERKVFYNCRCLKNVEFYKNSELLSIEDHSFYHTSINKIVIPLKTKYIQYRAFYECYELNEVKFDNKSELIMIGVLAFQLTAISNFCVPSSLKFYQECAFEDIKSIKLEENSQLISIDTSLLSENENCFFIPDNVKEILKYALHNDDNKILHISISPNNKNFKLIDNKMVVGKSDPNKDIFDDLIMVCHDIKEVKIPSYIKRISSNCFKNCIELKTVEFESNSSLICIDENAFMGSSMIESITIPKHVKTIGKSAFGSCSNLRTINILNDSELEFIDKGAFSYSPIRTIFIPKNFKNECFHLFSQCLDNVFVSSENKNIKIIDNKIVVGKSDQNINEFDTILFAFRDITDVVIPRYIKYLSPCCFYMCKKLKNVEFEKNSNIISIGQYSFYGTSIENISIPVHLKEIDSFAFYNAEKLKTFTFSYNSEIEPIENNAFDQLSQNANKCLDNKFDNFQTHCMLTKINEKTFNKTIITEIFILSSVEIIEKYSFDNCNQLKKVIFDKNSKLTVIKEMAFRSTQIEEIIIPQHVKLIEKQAFLSCKNLQIIEFEPNSELETIDDYAFFETSIKQIMIPKNVKHINKGSFCNNMNLEKFVFEENSELNSFSICSLYKTNVTQIFIPETVEYINPAFLNIDMKLKKIIVAPKNKFYKSIYDDQIILTKTGDTYDTIYYVYANIKDIKIPPYIKYISPKCFKENFDLKKIEFAENSDLQTIGKDAFEKTKLENIIIPANVRCIKNIFNECQNLKVIEFEANSKINTIGKNAFLWSSIEEFSIPKSLKELKNGWCHGTSKLNRISISSENKHFKIIDQKMIVGKSNLNKDVFDVLAFVCRDIERVTIPSYIKYISPYCFENCKKLKTVSLLENSELISIGKYAFAFSTIESIFIPKHCKKIEKYCFYSLTKLSNVEFSENSELEFISNNTFQSSNLRSIIIPSNVYVIEFNAFCCENLNCICFLGEHICLQNNSFTSCSCLLIEFPNALSVHIYKTTFDNADVKIFIRHNMQIEFN